MTGAPFETASDFFAAQGTLDRMVAAVTLFKIANDLRWLGSGIHELIRAWLVDHPEQPDAGGGDADGLHPGVVQPWQ